VSVSATNNNTFPPMDADHTLFTGAIVEEPDGLNFEPIKVLIALQDKFDLCDMAGPLEVFNWAQHDRRDPGKQTPTPQETPPNPPTI
jgi:hypothetical protein